MIFNRESYSLNDLLALAGDAVQAQTVAHANIPKKDYKFLKQVYKQKTAELYEIISKYNSIAFSNMYRILDNSLANSIGTYLTGNENERKLILLDENKAVDENELYFRKYELLENMFNLVGVKKGFLLPSGKNSNIPELIEDAEEIDWYNRSLAKTLEEKTR